MAAGLLKHIAGHLELTAIKVSLSDQMRHGHTNGAKGDKPVKLLFNIWFKFFGSNQRHPPRLNPCRMGQKQPCIPRRVFHPCGPQARRGSGNRLSSRHTPISAIWRA